MFPRLSSSSVAGILSERRHLLHYSLETGGGGGGDLVVKEEDVVTTGWFGWSGEGEGRKSSPVSLSLSLPVKESVYSILLLTLQGKESRRKSFGRERRGGGGNEIQACIGGGGGGGGGCVALSLGSKQYGA